MTSTDYSAPSTALARPRVLLAALATSAATAILTIVSQGLVLSGGEEAAREAVEAELGAAAELAPLAVPQAMDTLQSRAWLGIVVAGVVLVLTVVAARAGRVGRGFLTAFLVIGAFLMLRSVSDVFPADAQLPGVVALILAPIAVVLLYLPPVGRYRAARRAG